MLEAAQISPTRDSDSKPSEFVSIPLTVEQTGLSKHFLLELIAKHLYAAGELDQLELANRTGLTWQVIEPVVVNLREAAFLEIRRGLKSEMRYCLTKQGKSLALDALAKSTYTGVAPVTLDHYQAIVQAQSVNSVPINLKIMRHAYQDVVINEKLLSQMGTAIVSGRSIMVYGGPGTGKTYIARRIIKALGGSILVPHAILVADKVIKIFDPVIHKAISEDFTSNLILTGRNDARFVVCERPAAITGGELTLDMLEVNYDSENKVYEAPSQLKANNGVFIVDDLGRQRVRAVDLLNRWIIPMEEKRDFHSVGGGTRFEVPCDIVLVFSTNLNPLELADEAFLRRLGYKIKFEPMCVEDYAKLWQEVCEAKGFNFNKECFDFLIYELYANSTQPMVPCHPRDLLGLVEDHCRFQEREKLLTKSNINWAWNSYFVQE